ncbi:phenylacetate--CoA ligase family protein [Plantibacter sp. T3]|uniref:phenylacetate--CoA ligase family protein n=1 Tax=Plantibacter sp. T3 TaxID=2653161 RepID=UPI0012F0451B|nr:hypothetical protein [Plantibacter sp. T3]VXB73808.1 conserved hypothetical protein [Plantibacter sp. T3]
MRRAAFTVKTVIGARSSRAALREFRANDTLEPTALASLQAERSIAHARFAFEHTTFYRDWYSAHGVTGEDLRDPAAFSSLPLLDKETVREHFDSIRSDEATPETSTVSSTGGSTGRPLRLLRDLRFPARALEWRLLRWWDVRPWEDRGIVTRHVLTGRAATSHNRQWWPSKRVELDAQRMDSSSMAAFVAEWNRVRPPFLLGYVGGVLELARYVEQFGPHFAPPRAIALTAAPLGPAARAEIQSALGAPAYDHYRSAEVPWIAGEGPAQDGLYVFDDVRRVEILRADGTPTAVDETGEVVATDLTNRVFPLIRYRIGDTSARLDGPGADGFTLTRIAPVGGRTSDALRLPSGVTISGALGHIFDDAPWAVRQFEIEQAEDFSVVLRCIMKPVDDAPAALETAVSKLRAATLGEVPVTVSVVDTIPHVGGKMRFIRSSAPHA